MARVQEGFYSRPLSDESAELLYFIDQTSDELEARDALLAEAPSTYDQKTRDKYRVEPIGIDLWRGMVTYKPKGIPALPDGEPIRGIEFSTHGERRRIMTAINTTRYDASSWTGYSQGSPILEDESGRINGTEIVVPRFNFVARRRLTASQLTNSYVDYLIGITGKVNNANWLGFVPKQVLFLGADGSQNGQDADIVYSFAVGDASTIGTSQTVAGITVSGGYYPWDFPWVLYKTETPSGATRSAQVAKEVHVCQVYLPGDFSGILL